MVEEKAKNYFDEPEWAKKVKVVYRKGKGLYILFKGKRIG